MLRKKLFSLSLFAVTIMALQGCIVTRRTIIGSVVGPNGELLNKATITTSPPTQSVFTDSLGRFVIKEVPAGKYVIRANKVGFKESEVSVNVSLGGVIQADIQLEDKEKPASDIDLPASDDSLFSN